MKAYQQRVVDEKTELDAKLTKLKAFFTSGTGVFQKLPQAEQERMQRQAEHMSRYSDVLGERISAFQ
jgi:hypothetical protein